MQPSPPVKAVKRIFCESPLAAAPDFSAPDPLPRPRGPSFRL